MATLADYESSRRLLEAEGLEMQPFAPGKAEEDDNDNDDEMTESKEVGPGDYDPGLDSLGLGVQLRLGSETPTESSETSRATTPNSDGVPGLCHSPGSSTMDEVAVEEPQSSMAYDDQLAALHSTYASEHTRKQAERPASEERPVTPDTRDVSARSLSLEKSVASPYAEHEMNIRAVGTDRSPVVLGYSPTSPSNVIVREPITTSAQQRVPKIPEGHRKSTKGRNGGGRAASGSKAFKCPFPGCDKRPFKSKFELNSHQNIHKITGDFPCRKPVCNKRFRRLSDRNRHEERSAQHGGKGIPCPYCSGTEQTLARIDNLKKHIIRHHGIDKLEEYSRVDKTRPRPPQQMGFEFIAFRPK
ncbi:hypothetical protein CBER1_09290 [Cercospora berteroae]|uniref:C2H2-type domain-containing protein n=1 Tax=Cercospora berteroae TaxID=357750 RepID=A0A2S6CFD6_9PEZI|nr:hypothetical protein CBER1_09290 [Cercospora berteroae]